MPGLPRCNDNGLGFQDRFGSNMRAMGCVMGGKSALGGATEHQGKGTPHFHCEGHVVCAYQYDTMLEIAGKFRQQKITLSAWKKYNEWLQCESVNDEEAHETFKARVDEYFFTRFSAREHDGMSTAPEFLVKDATSGCSVTVSTVNSEQQKEKLHGLMRFTLQTEQRLLQRQQPRPLPQRSWKHSRPSKQQHSTQHVSERHN